MHLDVALGKAPGPNVTNMEVADHFKNGEPIGRTISMHESHGDYAVCATDKIMIVLHAELYNFPSPRAVHHEFMKIREAISSNVSDVIRLGSIL
jgi:hypothetical protein